jgi:cardiolipin synthase
MSKHNKSTQLIGGNQFSLISDGHQFLERMLTAIEASERYVLAEFYLVESGAVADRFIAALSRASSRGVQVRAIFDAFGSRALSERDRVRLRAAGIYLVFYNVPSWSMPTHVWLRDHRKLLLVDGTVGFTGGAGITDVFSPDALPQGYWQDCMVEMRGPILAQWHQLFARTWPLCQRQPLDVAPHETKPLIPGVPGRVVSSSGLGRKDLLRSVVTQIRGARHRVWLATAYFLPSVRLRRALRRAARRGVDVRLILTGPYTDAPSVQSVSRLFYGQLLSSGVVIYEFQQRFLHCKLALCDDWVSIGSSNLDRWGTLWNLEANQEVQSSEFAQQAAALCTQICSESLVLQRPEQVQPGWIAYLQRALARLILAWSNREVLRMRRLRAARPDRR